MNDKGWVVGIIIILLVTVGILFYSTQAKPAVIQEKITPTVTEEITATITKPVASLAPTNKKVQGETVQKQPTTIMNQQPKMQIDSKKLYEATLKTTEGEITLTLNAKDTPITVNNFVSLSKEKFYDNTIFHRVINGFMIQGGDPLGNGTGGPGYKFNDEPIKGEYIRGTIAMANSGPNTNGSQFFIMHKDYALPKNYVIFGKVIKGIEVVDTIATAKVETSMSGEQSKPVSPVKIQSVTVVEKNP